MSKISKIGAAVFAVVLSIMLWTPAEAKKGPGYCGTYSYWNVKERKCVDTRYYTPKAAPAKKAKKAKKKKMKKAKK